MRQHDYFKITVQDNTTLEVKVDKCEMDPVGVVHIIHGMAEHMDRYDAIAHELNLQGYYVIRHNQRGHGKDIDEKTRGYYDSLEGLVDDALEIYETILPDFPEGLPYIVNGHSMGSIVARMYAIKYPDVLNGLILSGTGNFPKWKGYPAMFGLKLCAIFTGKRRKLDIINKQLYQSLNKRFQPVKSVNDWLTSVRADVEKFDQDQYAGFKVSNQLLYETVKSMMKSARIKNIQKMNPDLPVLMISGKDDPFGDYGIGVRNLGRLFKKGNIQHITVQLYRKKRHEILFEKDNDVVLKHMFEWIDKQIVRKFQSE
ncbi:lysophospholipase [Staphylococcus massiliensis]|uniref:alpha/beta fold hydrolase n=1 Tax=Staphylococcus massiliensis TaxID=555791 RepID=UPI001EDE0363|nr:alpha/beta fold hydrolase [Staphylococcus massiliensis]MCG3412567.1 lysophospholipase [Staphylococcus massiliensis]